MSSRTCLSPIALPGQLTGADLANLLISRWPTLPIIITTGYADTAFQDEGQLGSGMEVLAKPFSVEAFAARVDRLLGN